MTVIGNPATMGKMGIPIYLTVTVTTGAVVTATNGSKTVSGTSASGSCTLKLPEAGTWTVSATLNGTSTPTKTIMIKNNYSTTLFFVGSTLNNTDWDIISAVSDAGQSTNYWSIGDRKAVTLNGTVGYCTFSSATYYCFIIGFDHNSTYEGTNRIHFQFGKTALTAGDDIAFIDGRYENSGSTVAFRMNTSSTNDGGWESSYMRQTICGTSLLSYSGTFIGVLPSELRSVLKSVTKYSDNVGNRTEARENITATTDYIFLLAEYEVFGTSPRANDYEYEKQAQYAYYSAGNSQLKERHSATYSPASWWLRSVNGGGAHFLTVSTGGVSYNQAANISYGFAPGFCV